MVLVVGALCGMCYLLDMYRSSMVWNWRVSCSTWWVIDFSNIVDFLVISFIFLLCTLAPSTRPILMSSTLWIRVSMICHRYKHLFMWDCASVQYSSSCRFVRSIFASVRVGDEFIFRSSCRNILWVITFCGSWWLIVLENVPNQKNPTKILHTDLVVGW